MDIPRQTREELNALSKEVFGVPSRWQKLLRNGSKYLVTKKTTEEVPGKDGEAPTTKEIEVPVLTEYGAKQYRQKYYTVDDIRTLLLEAKAKMDEMRATVKKQQEEQAALKAKQELEDKIKEDAQGSAL